jgi:glycine hydroxymethyltransferase
MVLMDLSKYGPGKGVFVQEMLDAANITVNKNTVPGEQSSPFYPSGIRLGTPALTTRGMREPQMEQISAWIADLTKEAVKHNLPTDKTERTAYLHKYKASLGSNQSVSSVKRKVHDLCALFPMPY